MVNKYQLFENTAAKSFIRILEVDKESNCCYLIEFKDDQTVISDCRLVFFHELPAILTKYTLATKDPTSKIISDENLTESAKMRRDKRYALIEPIIACKPKCYDQTWVSEKITELIKEAEKVLELNPPQESNTKLPTRYKYKSYLQCYFVSGGLKNSLISNHQRCGGADKQREAKKARLGRRPCRPTGHEKVLTDEDKDNIKWSWHHLLNKKRDRGSLRAAYQMMFAKFYSNCEVYPSESQFKYWGTELGDPTESKETRVGKIDFRKDHRALVGNARKDAPVIGAEAQFDATVDDTHALSLVFENTYIGRLTLFLMPDTLTTMPLSIVLVPDTPNHETSCLGIIYAAKNKVAFCKTLDIDIEYDDWPCEGVPAKITSDLGLLNSQASNSIVNNLGIEIDNCEGESPFYKPIVERHIGKLLSRISVLLVDKGLTSKINSPRIATDPRRQATLNYKKILAIMVHEMLDFIKTEPIEGYPTPFEMEQLGILPTALNLWRYFSSKVTPALRKFDPVELAIKLLPSESCSYDRTGIDFFGKWQCATEEGLKVFNNLLHGNGPPTLQVGYNRLDRNEAYLIYQDKHYPLYPINNIDDKIYTFYEMTFFEDLKKTLKIFNKHNRLNGVAKKLKAQQEIIDKATKQKNKSGPVNIKNKPSAREADKAYFYAEQKAETNGQSKAEKISHQAQFELSMPDFEF